MTAKKHGKNQGGVQLLRVGVVWTVLVAVLVVLSITAIAIGSAGYSFRAVLGAIFSSERSTTRTVVLNLRLPRVILALLIGGALSAAGALLQAVMRNPLADPGTIGVSAGAGTAAITVLLIFPNLTLSLPLFAFVGAALACVLIYALAWKGGVDPVRIILSGVAINSVLGGYNSLLQLMNSDNLSGVLAFMNGSLSGMSWVHVRTMAVYALVGLALALLCIRHANALQLGDEMAKNLGIRVNASRVCLSAVSAFLAASTVSVAGMIGFVGLVVPHISRMLVGSDYKVLMPTSILLGGSILLFADTVGRTIIPGMEIPVGIFMAVSGGPFFLYMLRKRGKFNGS
ncbi:Probable siderophore transport system permease protein yfhA [Anaerotruncus sp. 2789STDY5834896]|uniref:Probable siderophore transport system permease protein yfhA n=1 Tax=uncultured Anaerotruncus sp. TaxID=905011 RepID=A0A1C6IRI0_9FIRM|nr:Probable siderophore transport system permease protein yfhA [uncultured Anaerotruncus sp.]